MSRPAPSRRSAARRVARNQGASPRTGRVRSDERRRQILDAATEAFARQGVAGTSMQAVARAVGVDRVILYRLFPSREALFAAVVADLRADVLDAVERAGAVAAGPGTPGERTRRVLSALLAAAREHPAACRLLRAAPRGPAGEDPVGALQQEIAERVLERMVRIGRERRPWLGREEVGWGAAFLLHGMLGALQSHVEREPPGCDERFVTFLAAMADRLLAPRSTR